MSGLRYFDDVMSAQIKCERRLRQILSNAQRYATDCATVKYENSPTVHTGTLSPLYRAANEGLCAVRIILSEVKQ